VDAPSLAAGGSRPSERVLTGGRLAMPPVADWPVNAEAHHTPELHVGLGGTGGLSRGMVRRVTEYMQKNLDRELRLAELSTVLHMSPYHFARLFKQSTGVPPHRFVLQRRIAQATALLGTRTLSIGEIARTVGFRTPSHFATTFRRITGSTPSRYRTGREAGRRVGGRADLADAHSAAGGFTLLSGK
jgi:AraC family transcriptional regulator